MNVRPIKTDADYQWALEQVEPYFENEPEMDTPEGDRFEVLLTLIEAYENHHYRMGDVTPRQVIAFCMEQNGYTQRDLAHLLGSRSRASEILSGKKDPSKMAIRKLSTHWHIPPECLISFEKYAA